MAMFKRDERDNERILLDKLKTDPNLSQDGLILTAEDLKRIIDIFNTDVLYYDDGKEEHTRLVLPRRMQDLIGYIGNYVSDPNNRRAITDIYREVNMYIVFAAKYLQEMPTKRPNVGGWFNRLLDTKGSQYKEEYSQWRSDFNSRIEALQKISNHMVDVARKEDSAMQSAFEMVDSNYIQVERASMASRFSG